MKHNLLIILSATSLIFSSMTITALIFGFLPCIVESDSMEPIYRASTRALVMHRLIGENILQGDASHMPQHAELTNANLIGKATFSIYLPGLAGLFCFCHSRPWLLWIIAVIFLILACIPEKE